jgi:hypothetical protein
VKIGKIAERGRMVRGRAKESAQRKQCALEGLVQGLASVQMCSRARGRQLARQEVDRRAEFVLDDLSNIPIHMSLCMRIESIYLGLNWWQGEGV